MANRHALFVIGGAFVFLSTAAGTTYYLQKLYPTDTVPPHEKHHPQHAREGKGQNQVINSIYDGIAREYDEKVGYEEWLTGIKRYRKKLLKRHAGTSTSACASAPGFIPSFIVVADSFDIRMTSFLIEGDVLEIAAGTGRNVEFYPFDRLSSLTLVEQSPQMVNIIRHKIDPSKRLARSKHEKTILREHVDVVRCDAHQLVDGLKEDGKVDCEGKYDVVVDTFGLCSFEDPVKVLRQMSRVCKPTGKILLMEHGRSGKWAWMDKHLDRNMEKRFEDWGCIWNKDIAQIVKDAGLVVVEKKRKHLGTCYIYVCKPATTDSIRQQLTNPSNTDIMKDE